MIYGIILVVFAFLIYAPQFWVQHVLRLHSKDIPDLQGTGGELAEHLIERFKLEGVVVEETEPNRDHYSPADNAVRLSPNVYAGKSMTAVATAAHEVGHAIQFSRNEPVSQLRTRYFGKAIFIQRIGTGFLMLIPVVTAIVKVPHVMILTALIGVLTMLVSVVMYVAILPEEIDASFGKAMPILIEGNYIDEKQIPAVRQVLRACAFTYVAGALADILRLWRWFGMLKGLR